MSDASISPVQIMPVCEKCGYVLTGLNSESRCPECGTLIAESSPELRQPPPWEVPGEAPFRGFIRTSAAIIFHPTRFFRALPSRANPRLARDFGLIQYAIASLLFGIATAAHASWLLLIYNWPWRSIYLAGLGLAIVLFVLLNLVTALAARLTNWEATYRGMRLPLPVVERGLHYHSAHYIPVALLACLTTVGYAISVSRGWISESHDTIYLYVLCGEVVLAAAYLFYTYWIAMRNLMFANR
jgi:hypothetical protein